MWLIITKAIGIGFDGEKIVLTTNNPNTLMEQYNKIQQERIDTNWDLSDDGCSSGGEQDELTHVKSELKKVLEPKGKLRKEAKQN